MNNYEINRKTLALIPFGEEKTKIIEEKREFFVNLSVMKIIDNSCKFFGSSYEGRLDGTKEILKVSHKSPIIIEETTGMIFFPTTSPRLERCIWISLNNIKDYYQEELDTIIKFSCGKTLKLDLSYGIIDNQILRSTRLLVLLFKRIKNFEKIA